MIEIIVFLSLFTFFYFIAKVKDLFSPIYSLLLLWTIFLCSFIRINYLTINRGIDLPAILIAFSNIWILTVIVFIITYKISTYSSITIDIPKLPRKYFWILSIIYFVIFIIYLKIEFIDSGHLFPIYTMLKGKLKDIEIEKIHRFGKDSKLQILISQLPFIGTVFVIYGMRIKDKFLKYFSLTLAMLIPIFGLIKTSKSDIFFPLFLYLIAWYYTTKNRKKNIILFTIALLTVAIGIYITYERVISLGGNYSELISFDQTKALIKIDPFIFGYTSANMINFFSFLKETNYTIFSPYLLGLSFFRPIMTLIQKSHVIDSIYLQINLHYLGPGATVGTYLRTVYIEGGVLLTFLASFTYSLIVSLSYLWLKKSKNLYALLSYSIFYIPWVMLFFQNLFANLNIYFSYVLIILIYLFSKRRNLCRLNSLEQKFQK